MADRRLFILSAVLTKHNGTILSTVNAIGYRVATDGQDAVVGRYVQFLMTEHPGFALAGKVSVMEIPREDIEQALMKEPDHG